MSPRAGRLGPVEAQFKRTVAPTLVRVGLACETKASTKGAGNPAGPQTFMSSRARVAPQRLVRFHCIILCAGTASIMPMKPLFVCQVVFCHTSL